MNIFGKKKKNGDYLLQIVESLAILRTESCNMKESFKDHKDAECERRKIDRVWQKGIDGVLAKAIECPKGEQIDTNTKDIKGFKDDKQLDKGKFMGMKRIWAIFIGVGIVVMLVLNIMWKLRML